MRSRRELAERFLLDTNILSEVRKPHGDVHVKRWFTAVPEGALFLSVLTLGEIRRGIARRQRHDPAQATLYEVWLAALRRDYADRLLPITAEIADEWGRLNVPDPLPTVDGLLAATAKVNRLTLVTRNEVDVARCGVPVLNPFTPASH